MDKILCSKREAAEILGVSVRTIENLIVRKLLISRQVGRRRLIPYAALVQVARRDTPVITGGQREGMVPEKRQ
ncbi:MAG: helix-turn-helix domain-containing protein [Candidatus Acidiferrales bacterium]